MNISFKSTALTLSVLPLLAWAAPADNLPQLNQLDAAEQQRQQQYQQAQEAQHRPEADVRLDMATAQPIRLSNHEYPCYPIHRITFTDYGSPAAESQFQWAFEQAVQDLKLTLPHCFGGEGLSILMKQVQNNIVAQGYVTTRVVIEEQNLRGGTLGLTAIAGKVRNTIIVDNGIVPRFTKLHALTGLTFAKGDILNVRDIEQSLENLKRAPTVEANIEIIPSEDENAEVGESDLKISYAQGFPFRLNLGLDDAGSKSTGKLQASATLLIDNIFSANDMFYTSFTHSLKQKGDESGKRASKYFSLYYAIPFGYWQLAFSHSQNRYHQEIFGAFDNNYLYSGESENDKLTLSYMLYRDSVRKTTLSGSLWSRQSQNYIDGAEVEVQKRRMAGWEAGIAHKEYLGNSTLELAAHYKRGTGARGQLAAPEELWGEGTSRPQIITASISYDKPFRWGEQPWQFNTSWNAQWNKTPLIMQDRFSLGGRYTVRGFDGEVTLSGERGWLWRNELAWNPYGKGQQLYLALDGGRAMGWSMQNQAGHHLIGSALGLRGYLFGLNYDVFAGRPLSKPTGFKTSNTVAGFNISYAF